MIGLVGEMKTVNLGHVRDDAIIQKDDTTSTDILNFNLEKWANFEKVVS